MLTILIIISVLLLSWLTVSIVKKDEDGIGGSLTFIFIIIILGWGFPGITLPVNTTRLDRTLSVLKESNAIHLSDNGKIVKTYTDIPTYVFLSNSNETTVIKIDHFNIYGGCVNTDWEFPKMK